MAWLTVADVKEELSVAYLHAIAAHVGLHVQAVTKDRDSVDLEVWAKGLLAEGAALRSPRPAVQLKASAVVSDGQSEIAIPLSLKNYDDLRASDVHVPRILALLVLPPDDASRLAWSTDELVLRKFCYWLSLKGMPAVERNPDTAHPTVTVRVPTRNALSPDELFGLLVRVSQQRELTDEG